MSELLGPSIRVNRGAALLDERLPQWAQYVHAVTVHSARQETCVLAHLGERDPRVLEGRKEIPAMLAEPQAYRSGRIAVLGWPRAGLLEELGFLGECYAGSVNLLDAAWMREVQARGGGWVPKRGRRPKPLDGNPGT